MLHLDSGSLNIRIKGFIIKDLKKDLIADNLIDLIYFEDLIIDLNYIADAKGLLGIGRLKSISLKALLDFKDKHLTDLALNRSYIFRLSADCEDFDFIYNLTIITNL